MKYVRHCTLLTVFFFRSSWSYQEAMTSTTFGFFGVDDTYDSSYDVLDYTLSAQIPCSLTQSTQTQVSAHYTTQRLRKKLLLYL